MEQSHDSIKKFECDKCGNVLSCQKTCPYEVIGCMFEHSASGKCQYEERCTKKLCTFQHKKHNNHSDTEDEEENDVEEAEKVSQMLSDDNTKTVDQSSNEEEESFQLYVRTNYPTVFNKFKTEKTIKCYYCDFLPKSIKLRDLEDEMITHVADNHKDVIEKLDEDIYDDEYH